MEVRKIREDQFDIVLHIDELEKFNINFLEFMSKKIEDQKFFKTIINYIDKICNFSLNNKKFIFETFFIDNSYFLIKIYIVGFLSADGNFISKSGNKFKISQSVPLIFRFSSFDNICDFFHNLSICNTMNIDLLNYLELYKYKNNYYVIIKEQIFTTKLLNFACLQLSEFAEYISCSDILARRIEEFGCNIIGNFINIMKN